MIAFRISDADIERYLQEDVPYFDLTTTVLGFGGTQGMIEFYTREPCIVCGTEEVARILAKLDCCVEALLPSGAHADAGDTLMRATGVAASLHMAWKVSLNLLDHLSAIATKTKTMVDDAKRVSPAVEILTTRKSMPGTKSLVTKAILSGGALPHRLGISETMLVFDQHIAFMGGFEKFLTQIPEIKTKLYEKKLIVETTLDHAKALADAGVDGLQFDKASPEDLASMVKDLRASHPHIALLAAGGINPNNVATYAKTGVDGIVTTALFSAKPLDMSARIMPV